MSTPVIKLVWFGYYFRVILPTILFASISGRVMIEKIIEGFILAFLAVFLAAKNVHFTSPWQLYCTETCERNNLGFIWAMHRAHVSFNFSLQKFPSKNQRSNLSIAREFPVQ
jgi:hypothetical protein